MPISEWIALGGLTSVIIGALIAHERRDARRQRESDKQLSRHRTVLVVLCREFGVNGDLMKSLEED